MAWSKEYDWKSYKSKRGFPYSSTRDPLYIKERRELFLENGNGWWIKPPETDLYKNINRRKKLAKQIKEKKSNV
jgi:hypothetical protein